MGVLTDSVGKRPTIGKVVGNFVRGFGEFLEQVASHLDSLSLEKKQPMKDFMILLLSNSGARKTSVELLTKDDEELTRFLLARAWWVLHKDINGDMKRELLRLGREGKSEQIDEYFCAQFRAEGSCKLRSKVRAWVETPYLNERHQIISDSLEAHMAGKYTLTIPTLLPLLDGLIRQFFGAHKVRRRGKNHRGAIQVNQFAAYYRRKEHKFWGAPFEKFLNHIAYISYEFGNGQPPNSFNRHGILHGELSGYASETNSLKVFLLLDTAAQFVRTVEKGARSVGRAGR